MSKELEELYGIKSVLKLFSSELYEKFFSGLDTIEKALERLEKHDKIFKEYDIDDNWLDLALYVIKDHFPMDTETQLMKLTALRIINEKEVDVGWLKASKNLTEYNFHFKHLHYRLLTQEEFDFLKEALK